MFLRTLYLRSHCLLPISTTNSEWLIFLPIWRGLATTFPDPVSLTQSDPTNELTSIGNSGNQLAKSAPKKNIQNPRTQMKADDEAILKKACGDIPGLKSFNKFRQ